jgi:hypothetical protein
VKLRGARATLELKRGQITERLMRTDGFVDALPGVGLAVERGDAKVAEPADLIE